MGITDAAYANQDKLQSRLGHFITLNTKVLGGRSSKASVTCTSSTEAEVYSIAETIPRLENLKLLLQVIDDKDATCELKSDSQPGMSAIRAGDVSKIKSKFYGTKLLRIKEEIEKGNVDMNYINTKENTADMLTKALSIPTFQKLKLPWM